MKTWMVEYVQERRHYDYLVKVIIVANHSWEAAEIVRYLDERIAEIIAITEWPDKPKLQTYGQARKL